MGWNSFDCYGCAANERVLKANLEAFAERLKPYGYEYFVLDNGWFADYAIKPGKEFTEERHAQSLSLDEYGRLVPSPVLFPNGLRPIIDRAHELGVKFGIHIMRGISRQAVEQNTPIKGTHLHARDIADVNSTCVWCHYNYGVDMNKPGAQEFYNSWIESLAEMGIDFIKADDIIPFPREIIAVADAIEQQDRPMVLSLSPGRTSNLGDLAAYQRANMVRITHDIWDRRSDFDKCFERWNEFAGTERPGFWPDLDMLSIGRLQVWRPKPEGVDEEKEADLVGAGFERDDRLTSDQKLTFLTMRALAATPLFMGGELLLSEQCVFDLITNREMIACNQNGVMGRRVYAADGVEVWRSPEKGKEHCGWLGIFNRNQVGKDVALRAADLQLPQMDALRLRDIWNGKAINVSAGQIRETIPADGVLFLRYEI